LTLPPSFRLHILTPVFDDWTAAALLLQELDQILAATSLRPHVLLIDDGSAQPAPPAFPDAAFRVIASVEILDLYRNLGHQRAICCGMVHLYQKGGFDALLVLDADGEDSPKDALELVRTFAESERTSLVFASRSRRTEGSIFRLFYQFYRTIHRLLIGHDIRIGNFSVIPPKALAALVRSGGLWNHYAATASRLRMPLIQVPIAKTKRLHGHSKMNFIGLVIHGFRAFTVHIDTAAARTLVMACLALAGGMAAMAVILFIRFGTNFLIPGWTPLVMGLIVLTLLQIVMLTVLFTLGVLMTGAAPEVLPIRDCPYYIAGGHQRELSRTEPLP
jgi:hypothetical protein